MRHLQDGGPQANPCRHQIGFRRFLDVGRQEKGHPSVAHPQRDAVIVVGVRRGKERARVEDLEGGGPQPKDLPPPGFDHLDGTGLKRVREALPSLGTGAILGKDHLAHRPPFQKGHQSLQMVGVRVGEDQEVDPPDPPVKEELPHRPQALLRGGNVL